MPGPITLPADEPCFPRGSARRPSGAASKPAPSVDNDVLFGTGSAKLAAKRSRSLPLRKSTTKRARPDTTTDLATTNLSPSRAHILIYNKLSVGTKLLGVVQSVSEVDMVVALPHGLSGMAALRELSDVMCGRVDRFVDGNDDHDDEDSDLNVEDEALPDMTDLFFVGQIVFCVVSRLDRSTNGKHIDLTLRPSLFNAAWTSAPELPVNLTLPGAIDSIETHGYVVDLGVPGSNAFLPFDQIDPDRPTFVRGQTITVSVVSVSTVVSLTTIGSGQRHSRSSWGLSLESLMPGALVRATIDARLPDGFRVMFLKGFTGTVDHFHVGDRRDLAVGSKVDARILFVDPERKLVGLTMRSDLVAGRSTESPFKIGHITDAVVVGIDALRGLLLRIGDRHDAFAHISQSSDRRLTRLEKDFEPSQIVRCRVLGYKPVDGALSVSLRESVLDQAIMNIEDANSGEIVEGVISSVESFGLLVQLAPGIRALCPLAHLTEQALLPKNHGRVLAQFNPGQRIKSRILYVELDSRRLTLTMKKTLLASTETIFASTSDAYVGAVAHGYVSSVNPKTGVYVNFYGRVFGLVPKSDLTAAGVDDIAKAYHPGQVLRVQVVRVPVFSDASDGARLGLSVRVGVVALAAKEPTAPMSLVDAIVTGFDEDGAVGVQLAETKEPARIPAVHLTDHLSNVASLAAALPTSHPLGTRLAVVVLGRHQHQSLYTPLLASCKPSLMAVAGPPLTFDQLVVGASHHAYVVAIESFGAFVAFHAGLDALCPKRMFGDDLQVGQSVVACVVEVEAERQRVVVSLRASDCIADDAELASLSRSYFTELAATTYSTNDDVDDTDWSRYSFGDIVNACVLARKDVGTVFALEPPTIKGFAMSPANIDPAAPIEVGASIDAIVLDVDRRRRIVDLAARPNVVAQRRRHLRQCGNPLPAPIPGETVVARVELCKDNHLVLSLPEHGDRIAFAIAYAFNGRVGRESSITGVKFNAVVVGDVADRLVVRLDVHELVVDQRGCSSSWTTPRPQIGDDVFGTIGSFFRLTAIVHLQISKTHPDIVGHIYIGDVTDDELEDPFKQIPVGTRITAKVVNIVEDGATTVLDLSLRSTPRAIKTAADIAVGQVVHGFVRWITDHLIWVALSPSLKACVHQLMAFDDPVAAGPDLHEHFRIGQPLNVTITSVDASSSRVDATLNGIVDPKAQIVVGANLPGRIVCIDDTLHVEVAPRLIGRVPLIEVADVAVDNPLEPYSVDQIVSVRVTAVNQNRSCVALSLRSGTGTTHFPYIAKIGDLTAGQLVQGYISSIGRSGCSVALSATVSGHISTRDLSDQPVRNLPAAGYRPGRRVLCRVLEVLPPKRVSLSLKKSVVTPLEPGLIITGTIHALRDTGALVRIDNEFGERLTGLAHISKIFDDDNTNGDLPKRLADHYAVGDSVRARVISFDAQAEKISLSLKHSDVVVDEDDCLTTMPPTAMLTDAACYTTAPSSAIQIDEVDELDVPEELAACVDGDDDVASQSGNDDEAAPAASTTARKSMLAKTRIEEARIERLERAQADPMHRPESIDDFERLVLASPNSSLAWCRYIAFQLSLNEISAARSVAERALVTIATRDESELLNVWMALINLENMFGAEEALVALVERAGRACDQKKLLGRVAAMYELSKKRDACDDTHAELCKRFASSRNAWANAAAYRFRTGRADTARTLLSRALRALPRRKHIRIITTFALFEFKMGVADRGRTILEGILSNYPKRVDIWSVYLDQEIRLGDPAVCRRLLERLIHLDLSVKKMKYFFKRYLQFEREHGSDETVASVKEAAKAYVARRIAI